MAAPAKRITHFFVLNQLGQSAHRHGAFESREAAEAWVKAHYNFPCWLVPAEYIGNMPAQPLDAEGKKFVPE